MSHTRAADLSLDATLDDEWRRWVERGRDRSLRAAWARSGAEVMTETGPAIDFSSNDYLGLASDERLVRAVETALDGDAVGAAASRLIAGNHPAHERLEVDIAGFFGAPAALVFNTGFTANVGAIPALVGPRDAIFADALNHASLIDGCRLSGATVHTYSHGDTGALRALLEGQRDAARYALIVTDGLFSMDGDVAPVAQLLALAEEFGAWTYVDDAHAVGVIGPGGRGTAEAAGVHGRVDVTVGTLGKAFGVAGAFAYGSASLKRHLMNRARSFVFSTAMIPAQAAAASEALRIVAAEPERRARLFDNARQLREALAPYGDALLGDAGSHVIPLLTGASDRTVEVGAALRKRGLLVGAVRPPTVAEGRGRLRISVSAAHTAAHIDALATALRDVHPPR
jgi:8-amino-7-oxononanoate synthase